MKDKKRGSEASIPTLFTIFLPAADIPNPSLKGRETASPHPSPVGEGDRPSPALPKGGKKPLPIPLPWERGTDSPQPSQREGEVLDFPFGPDSLLLLLDSLEFLLLRSTWRRPRFPPFTP